MRKISQHKEELLEVIGGCLRCAGRDLSATTIMNGRVVSTAHGTDDPLNTTNKAEVPSGVPMILDSEAGNTESAILFYTGYK